MERRLAVVILAAALGAGCAGAGLSSPEGWSVVRTRHFNFHTTTDEHRYAPTLTALEYSYASLSSSFFKNVELGQVDVLYVDSSEDFKGLFGQKRDTAALPTVPGGARIGKDGLVVMTSDREGNKSAEALAHLFIHKMMPAAPLWFHEGFAAYVRNLQYKEGGGQRVACFGYPGGKPESYVPLGELFTIGWDQYDEGPRSWYKGTARTLIDFVMHGADGALVEKMPGIIEALLAGRPSADVIVAELGPLAELDPKIVDHGNSAAHAGRSGAQVRGLCPIGFPIPDDRAPDLGTRKAEPVPAADMEALVAGLRRLPRLEEGYPEWFPPEVLPKD